MLHNIGLLMVTEGLLKRESLDAAVLRKKYEGGSLALNLVLVGAVDEVTLARFYARKLELEPATEEVLEGTGPDTFGLIPLEIIYDSGILPLYLQDGQTLAVGLVDPTDRDLLAEATFFSGYNLAPRLITVSQMARHFARLAGQPWRLEVAEADRLSQRDVRPQAADADAAALGIDSLLEQTVPLDQAMEATLEASLDEAYAAAAPTEMLQSPFADTLPPEAPAAEPSPPEEGRPPGMSIWFGGRAAEEISQIRIKAIGPSGDESGPIEVDQAQLDKAVVSTAQLPALRIDAPPPEEPLRRVDVDPSAISEVGLLAGSEVLRQDGGSVEGEAVTRTGPVKVLGFRMDSAMQTAVDEPMREPAPVVTRHDHGFGERPKTKVPAKPAADPSDVAIGDHVHLLTRLGDNLGEPDINVTGSIAQITAELTVVRRRDQLGETVVNGLSDWFATVAVMTLNGPRAVVWRCARGGSTDQELVGSTVDIIEGGVMHRVSQERVFYFGPLPPGSRLREGLVVSHDWPVLVAPVEMRGKTILLLVLDGGPDGRFRSPGRSLERLLVDLAKGLERVILLKRRGRRK